MRLVLGIGSKARKFLATSSVKENVLNGEGSAGQLESKGENVDDGCDAKITDIGMILWFLIVMCLMFSCFGCSIVFLSSSLAFFLVCFLDA